MLYECDGVRVLIDPGSYSSSQNNVENVHVILVTHKHQDHLHIESIETILKNNPKARVITNKSVGKLLTEKRINFEILEEGKFTMEASVGIEACGHNHAVIYSSLPAVENTGFFLTGGFYFPGDSFNTPEKKVEILALPVAGPWMKLSEAIDFAKELKPKICFPVHEGILKFLGPVHKVPEQELSKVGIQFVVIKDNETKEF